MDGCRRRGSHSIVEADEVLETSVLLVEGRETSDSIDDRVVELLWLPCRTWL